MNFRYDILELRGFAVLFVLFFHKGLLKGGFIGVDIFFVISGFLINSILQYNIDSNSFSLFVFYKKRVVRIIPLSCVVVMAVIMTLNKQNVLGKEFLDDGLSCLMLYFNIKRSMKKDSYFDSIYKTPFLHFWSLTVEEQFYIFFPLIVMFKNSYKFICSIILILSMSLYIIYIIRKIENSYYYSRCRFWEFMAGSVISNVKYSSKYNRYTKNIVIITIIFSSFILNNQNRIFLPFIIILATLYITIDNKNDILCNFVIKYIGEISYSVYLVHYPILILFNLKSYTYYVAVFTISVLSCHLIEKNLNSIKYFYLILLVWIISLLAILHYKNRIKILKNTIPYNKLEDMNMKEQTNMWCSHCHTADLNSCKILLVGDSHIEQWIPIISKTIENKYISIHHYYLPPNVVSVNKFIDYHFSFFKRNEIFEVIYVSFALRGDWLSNRRKFDEIFPSFITFLLSLTKYVVVIDDTPLLTPMHLCQSCCKNQDCKTCYGIVGSNITLLPSLPNYNDKRVIHLNMNDYFCEKNKCFCQRGDILVFEMWNHIFPSYIKTLSSTFENLEFNRHLKCKSKHYYNSSCLYYMHGNLFLRFC